MWVKREEWEALQRRVKWLEDHRVSPDEANFTIYDPACLKWSSAGYPYSQIPHQKVTIKGAIEKILAHLGVSLEYVKGTPDAVVLAKPACVAADQNIKEVK